MNIIHKCKINLSSNAINITFGLINYFLSLTNKNKDSDFNIHLINQTYKKLDLHNQKVGQHISLDLIKNNAFMSEGKEKILR